ncbi:hypothetical protein [Streptomyces sp. ISL-100]|uniref:hypothetical protein n=1 Tax=Streptomyces sp. ISL-100 TaxID=2819173 RepID=UPI001BE68C3A|nr:hypothetical protein [Streptomyces sp. ISL-100]MBT2400634.1 hypothetical protein [Streptomyces sp. ISL-100]
MPPKVPHLQWADFLDQFVWDQGEHVTFVGKTGSGKTTLAQQLLPRRDFVVALATKPSGRDKTMTALIRRERYKRIKEWPPPTVIGAKSQRVVLWPEFRRPEDIANQQVVLDKALRDIFAAGGWTVFADELFYLCKFLGMSRLFEVFWSQARSIGISIVGGTQRPAWVPLMAYSQCTHLFLYKTTDEADLKRIGGIGGLDNKLIREVAAGLPKYHALYVNLRDGELMTTKAEER